MSQSLLSSNFSLLQVNICHTNLGFGWDTSHTTITGLNFSLSCSIWFGDITRTRTSSEWFYEIWNVVSDSVGASMGRSKYCESRSGWDLKCCDLWIDNAQKMVSELIVHTCVNGCIRRTKKKNRSKGTDGVPAKNPSKVKLEESSNNAREYEL